MELHRKNILAKVMQTFCAGIIGINETDLSYIFRYCLIGYHITMVL